MGLLLNVMGEAEARREVVAFMGLDRLACRQVLIDLGAVKAPAPKVSKDKAPKAPRRASKGAAKASKAAAKGSAPVKARKARKAPKLGAGRKVVETSKAKAKATPKAKAGKSSTVTPAQRKAAKAAMAAKA